jgi:hypothetical protein
MVRSGGSNPSRCSVYHGAISGIHVGAWVMGNSECRGECRLGGRVAIVQRWLFASWVLAAMFACGAGAKRVPSPKQKSTESPKRGSKDPIAEEIVAIELDLRIRDTLYAQSIEPVARTMCRESPPAEACSEACDASLQLDEISLRVCRHLSGFEEDVARWSKCVDSRTLAKRANTTCQFCRGDLVKRPCPDIF